MHLGVCGKKEKEIKGHKYNMRWWHSEKKGCLFCVQLTCIQHTDALTREREELERNNSSEVKEAVNTTGCCRYKDPSAPLQKKTPTILATSLDNYCNCFIYAYTRTQHIANIQFQLTILLLKVTGLFQDISTVLTFPLFISLSIPTFSILFQSAGKKMMQC